MSEDNRKRQQFTNEIFAILMLLRKMVSALSHYENRHFESCSISTSKKCDCDLGWIAKHAINEYRSSRWGEDFLGDPAKSKIDLINKIVESRIIEIQAGIIKELELKLRTYESNV